MIEKIPPEFPIPTRRSLIDSHKRLRRILNPTIDISDGTEPDLDARVSADSSLPTAAFTKRLADCVVVETAFGGAIATWGRIHGVDSSPAFGSVGFVRISASTGGGFIQEGDPLFIKNQGTGPRFECALSRQYFNGQLVPIRSVGTGFETNLQAGTVLVWGGSPPGIHPEAVVATGGLSGGRPVASPEQHKRAILAKLKDPPGASNAAHYRLEAKNAGVSVEQAFSYSAVKGPSVIGIAFTVPPASRAGTRVPPADIALIVGEHLENAFGADDGVLITSLVEEPVTVSYRVKWKPSLEGWADSVPWPSFAAEDAGAIVVDSVTDALAFTLRTDDDDYDGEDEPLAGNTIAFYDNSVGRFVRKRIGTVTGSGPWDIVVDTTNNASDEQYTPVVGQRVSPWSDNLDGVASAVIPVFEGLGPGEVVYSTSSDGNRRFREPRAPVDWPHTLTQSLLEDPVNSRTIASLFDREVVEGDGLTPTIGTPGVLAYILVLDDLGVFNKP